MSELTYDKRLLERLVRTGELTQAQVDQHLSKLPDVAANATEMETRLETESQDGEADDDSGSSAE